MFYTQHMQKGRYQKSFSQPTMTKQSFKQDCDVNNILKKYMKTGLIEHANRFQGRYGDFLEAPDYRVALDQVIAAQREFEALPSKIRTRFDNDPAQFLEFVQNQDNLEEMYDLGLANRPKPDFDSDTEMLKSAKKDKVSKSEKKSVEE